MSTDCFLDPRYADISAVLFSKASSDSPHDVLGTDFTLVHNPLAKAPLGRGWFRCWEEYWTDGKDLYLTRNAP
jgi:hypothetical protein